MAKKSIHVIPFQNGWAVKESTVKGITSFHRLKIVADRKARAMAKKNKVELIIHGKDGTIQDKDSFGHDPYPPPG